jgi:hypothetical protein
VNVVQVGSKLGEVIGKIRDEIGIENNRLVAKSFVSICKIVPEGREVNVINNDCPGMLNYLDCGFESVKDWLASIVRVIPLRGIPIRTPLKLEKLRGLV